MEDIIDDLPLDTFLSSVQPLLAVLQKGRDLVVHETDITHDTVLTRRLHLKLYKDIYIHNVNEQFPYLPSPSSRLHLSRYLWLHHNDDPPPFLQLHLLLLQLSLFLQLRLLFLQPFLLLLILLLLLLPYLLPYVLCMT